MHNTKIWNLNIEDIDFLKIEEAARLLHQQEVVAFPTETVYGLGADATKAEAVAKIFQAKDRPQDNPLIVHIANREQILGYVTHIPEMADRLISAFMPGPLTVILPSNGLIAENVTAGLSTVGFRIPDHPVALKLLEVSRLPLAAPSANRSGKPSPTKAEHVLQDLNGKIAGVVDGGTTGVGVESTVVDCTGEVPIILRPGGVTYEQLQKVVDNVMFDPALMEQKEKPKAPGMKYTHYEPEAPLWLVKGDADFFQKQIDMLVADGKRVAVMCSVELAATLSADYIKTCGSRVNLAEIAVHLYDTLRSFRKADVDVILCETFLEVGVGQAIMNRLTKASSYQIEDK